MGFDPLRDEDEPHPCCEGLRCKSMYYRTDERPGLLHDEEAMGYWCHKTTQPMGPDNKMASHRNCQPGRECFMQGPIPAKFRV